jgi:hypothetical protein
VAVEFLISARPASVVVLTPDAVRLSSDAVLVELRVFKYRTSGHAPRVSICLPTSSESDHIHQLFRLLIAAASRPSIPWFCARDLSAAAAASLRSVGAVAPPGTGSPYTADARCPGFLWSVRSRFARFPWAGFTGRAFCWRCARVPLAHSAVALCLGISDSTVKHGSSAGDRLLEMDQSTVMQTS